MLPLIKKTLKRAKLTYLWITRILFAPNRFKVPFVKRIRYAVNGGFIGDQIALYGLNHKNKDQYLSEFDWYRSRYINEPFDPMLNNKIVCNEVLQPHIAVPRILFIKNKGRLIGLNHPERLRPTQEVVDALRAGPAMFLKPLGSGKGKGVHRLEFVDGEFALDRKSITETDLLAKLSKDDGWFLSEGVEQHPDLAKIYDQTSNTIRLITMRDPHTGELRVFFAVMRIGTEATIPVDNGSRGGLVAKIDLDTGMLSEARTLWSNETFSSHPNSGNPIEGVLVPGWKELTQKVLGVADKLPFVQFIAWDVLVGEHEPFIIEANTSSGVNIIQLWGPQRQGELGDFYRAHGVIR